MTEIKTYTQMRDDFCAQYKKNIVPAFIKFDKERNLKLLIAKIVKTFLLVLGVLFLYFTIIEYKNGTNNYIITLVMTIISLVSIYYFNSLFAKNIDLSIKKKVMPILCQLLDDLTWIDGKGGYSNSNIYKRSLLASDFDFAQVDDVFVGRFDKIKTDIMDAELFKKQGNAQIKIFGGTIIKLDLGKNFQGHTVIPIGASASARKLFASKLKSMTLCGDDYVKPFEIFTTSELEANKFITPKFVESLENIRSCFMANQLICVFYENTILIGLNGGKSLFETSTLTQCLNNSKKFFNVFERYLAIIKFIDYIKLDI